MTPWPRTVSHLLWPRHIVQETAPGASWGGRCTFQRTDHCVGLGGRERRPRANRTRREDKDLVVFDTSRRASACPDAGPAPCAGRWRLRLPCLVHAGLQDEVPPALPGPGCVGRWRVPGGSIRRMPLCEGLEQAGCDCRGRKEAGEGRKRGTEAAGNSRHLRVAIS